MLSFLIIPLAPFLTRASGGGLGAHILNKKGDIDDATGLDKGGIMPFSLAFLPEVVFAFLLSR